MRGLSARGGLALLLTAGSAMPAMAANCKSDGSLAYLGNTRDASRSVWLSRTGTGSFALESAQGSQTVDTWNRPPSPQLHISASPVVSNGNGGTHKLLETSGSKPCQIDTQSQKGGITLPPIISNPVLPPIGNLFPDFGTGVRPPIGTLPPSGITPGVPGGVRPPIGTLPPSGITPGVPGGVRPPIGTLPPSGITPGVPGGVRPPIGTVPPGGLTPGVPGGVQPPIATLPPGAGGPGAPGGVIRPAGPIQAHGQVAASGAAAHAPLPCIDPRSPPAPGQDELPICPAEMLAAPPASEVPLTEGRDLVQPTLWNFWVQPYYVSVSDERFGLDVDTELVSLTMGLDRRLNDDFALGALISFQNSKSDGFDSELTTETNGFSIGPYAAWRLSPNWALDATLSFGRYDNDMGLSVLDGSYTSQQISGSVTAHGQYMVEEYFLRPKFSVSYGYLENDGYDMDGTILGAPIDVRFPSDSFHFGVMTGALEISRIFTYDGDKTVMPYLELGAVYAFEQPNDGEILTGDFQTETPSLWTGTLRSGFRMLITDRVQIDASGGYLSFGQSGLDIWEGQMQVSIAF